MIIILDKDYFFKVIWPYTLYPCLESFKWILIWWSRASLVILQANRRDFYRLAETNSNYTIIEKEKPEENEEEKNEEAEKDETKEESENAAINEDENGENKDENEEAEKGDAEESEEKNEEATEDSEKKEDDEIPKPDEEETLIDKVEDALGL